MGGWLLYPIMVPGIILFIVAVVTISCACWFCCTKKRTEQEAPRVIQNVSFPPPYCRAYTEQPVVYPGQPGGYPGQLGGYPGQPGGCQGELVYPGQEGGCTRQPGAHPGQGDVYPTEEPPPYSEVAPANHSSNPHCQDGQ